MHKNIKCLENKYYILLYSSFCRRSPLTACITAWFSVLYVPLSLAQCHAFTCPLSIKVLDELNKCSCIMHRIEVKDCGSGKFIVQGGRIRSQKTLYARVYYNITVEPLLTATPEERPTAI